MPQSPCGRCTGMGGTRNRPPSSGQLSGRWPGPGRGSSLTVVFLQGCPEPECALGLRGRGHGTEGRSRGGVVTRPRPCPRPPVTFLIVGD